VNNTVAFYCLRRLFQDMADNWSNFRCRQEVPSELVEGEPLTSVLQSLVSK